MAEWTDPGETAGDGAWARATATALGAFSSGAHRPNSLQDEPDALIRAADGVNYPRLAEVKRAYDPDNFLSVNLNVRPAG